jgi:hypothetical protein
MHIVQVNTRVQMIVETRLAREFLIAARTRDFLVLADQCFIRILFEVNPHKV